MDSAAHRERVRSKAAELNAAGHAGNAKLEADQPIPPEGLKLTCEPAGELRVERGGQLRTINYAQTGRGRRRRRRRTT